MFVVLICPFVSSLLILSSYLLQQLLVSHTIMYKFIDFWHEGWISECTDVLDLCPFCLVYPKVSANASKEEMLLRKTSSLFKHLERFLYRSNSQGFVYCYILLLLYWLKKEFMCLSPFKVFIGNCLAIKTVAVLRRWKLTQYNLC